MGGVSARGQRIQEESLAFLQALHGACAVLGRLFQARQPALQLERTRGGAELGGDVSRSPQYRYGYAAHHADGKYHEEEDRHP